MLSETRPDLSHLCSNFLLSRFAAAISALYQGALGLTVTRHWQSGACLSASSVKVELYCVTRAETLSAGVVTKANWATSNVKSLISTFFHFRYETCLDRKDGLSAAKLKITELWSETTCPWTDTLLTMLSVTRVMIRSSTWPWTWVGLVTWFCNPKEVSKSKNWHACESDEFSTWRLKSSKIRSSPEVIDNSSNRHVNSWTNIEKVNLFSAEGGGWYIRTIRIHLLFAFSKTSVYSNDKNFEICCDFRSRVFLKSIPTPLPLPCERGIWCNL